MTLADLLLLPIVVGLLKSGKDFSVRVSDASGGDDPGVRCPHCRWRPLRSSRWYCSPGCGHRWNTFDTRGVCPACDKRWDTTACLSCPRISAHDDWYERRDAPPG